LSRLVVHVAYFTDPLCPWSWGAEPQLRRLQVEFSDQVAITYVMAGMSREIDAPAKVASTLDVVAETGMPADPRIWLEQPPRSSYPACLAVKAAGEQQLDGRYLRRLREGAMLRRERLDNADALQAAARDVAGLDLARFEIDLRSNAIVELFAADRERSKAVCGDHRPALPAFAVEDGAALGPDELRDAVIAAGATPGPLPAVEEALRRCGPMATAEVAEVCGLPGPRARIELWAAAGEFRVRPAAFPIGELWELA
jgi:predicted DsbA family dithiol-disulfide isomerase